MAVEGGIRFSIVTCFHNSISRLERYFASLRRLDVADLGVEFILVDNASRDDTAVRIRTDAAVLPGPVTVLSESTPGLMYARCTGVAAARGEFVLFLDDDNEPQPNYVRELQRLLERYPDVGVITGNSVLPADHPARGRTPQRLLDMIAIRQQAGEFAYQHEEFFPPHAPLGAGLFGRRADLVAACDAWRSGNRAITGRKGTEVTSGEDVLLAHYLTSDGRPVVFSDRLVMVHNVDPGRFQTSYFARLAFENGREYPGLVSAVLEFKPALRHRGFGRARAFEIGLMRLPLLLLRCLVRPSAVAIAAAAGQLGLCYALLLRLADPRYRVSRPRSSDG